MTLPSGKDLPGTRAKARVLASSHYFTGKPCKSGHLDARRTKDGNCLGCSRAKSARLWREQPEKMRSQDRASRQRCGERVKRNNQRYYRENAERLKAQQREWNARNREHIAQRSRAYRKKHPEAIREMQRRHYEANKAAYYAANADRRARERAAESGCRKQLARVYRHLRMAPGLRCYWCDQLVPKGKRHIDHIIPLARGGAHAAANICLSCGPCNLSKNVKMPEEFAGQGELVLS